MVTRLQRRKAALDQGHLGLRGIAPVARQCGIGRLLGLHASDGGVGSLDIGPGGLAGGHVDRRLGIDHTPHGRHGEHTTTKTSTPKSRPSNPPTEPASLRTKAAEGRAITGTSSVLMVTVRSMVRHAAGNGRNPGLVPWISSTTCWASTSSQTKVVRVGSVSPELVPRRLPPPRSRWLAGRVTGRPIRLLPWRPM